MKTTVKREIFFVRQSYKGGHTDVVYFFNVEKAHNWVNENKEKYYGKLTVYKALTIDYLIQAEND